LEEPCPSELLHGSSKASRSANRRKRRCSHAASHRGKSLPNEHRLADSCAPMRNVRTL
jgi:hypothetical protein